MTRSELMTSLLFISTMITCGLSTTALAADEEEYVDLWSSPKQRTEWREWLQERSSSEVHVLYHPVGHLHGVSGAFQLSESTNHGVLEFLETLREQLGLVAGESLELVRAKEISKPSFQSGQPVATPATQLRYAIKFEGYPELGREIVVLLDEQNANITGVFNAHLPPIGGYVFGGLISTQDAISSAESSEGGSIDNVVTSLGW